MNGLTYIEMNGLPVISARNLYGFLTGGTGDNVCAWLVYCEGHSLFTLDEDIFISTTVNGHKDILLSPSAALIVCSVFKGELAKKAYELIKSRFEQVHNVEVLGVSEDDTSIGISEAAKILEIGPNELFKYLRDGKILNKRNIPLQYYVEQGYFKVVTGHYQDRFGTMCYYAKGMVTVKGLTYLSKLVSERNKLIKELAA